MHGIIILCHSHFFQRLQAARFLVHNRASICPCGDTQLMQEHQIRTWNWSENAAGTRQLISDDSQAGHGNAFLNLGQLIRKKMLKSVETYAGHVL